MMGNACHRFLLLSIAGCSIRSIPALVIPTRAFVTDRRIGEFPTTTGYSNNLDTTTECLQHRCGSLNGRSFSRICRQASPLSRGFQSPTSTNLYDTHKPHDDSRTTTNRQLANRSRNLLQSIRKRVFNTVEAAGYTSADKVLYSGVFGRVTRLHNPITYFVLFILAGFKWDWCFKSPLYWFVVGFCIKWYRARYVFKIPVWDRQPNWNNIITNKEQEKDLRAFTCKNCGSTIFIAKTREFFFEGDTGIGGLGCFACGAKGKDNFIMDRDRIVEDVGDMDDYFEYEQPLDFVSRAERRKLLKQTDGDETKANQILVDRANAVPTTGETEAPTTESTMAASDDIVDAVIEKTTDENIAIDDSNTHSIKHDGDGIDAEPKLETDSTESSIIAEEERPKKLKKKKKKATQVPSSKPDIEGLDVLDMDAF